MELCVQASGQESLPSSIDPLRVLVSQISQGSELALGNLYDATSSWVFGLTLKILREREVAEEAALDAYTQVWKQAARYDPDRGTVLSWILNLARSRAIDLLRSRNRRLEHAEPFEGAFDLPCDDEGPERAWLDSERADLVQRALAKLSVEQRRALEVVYFGGLTHEEAAEALGQPLGTVKTRIRNGLMALRRHLLPMQEELT